MENKVSIHIPIPKFTWRLIIAIVLIILACKLDPNNGYEILKEFIKNYK